MAVVLGLRRLSDVYVCEPFSGSQTLTLGNLEKGILDLSGDFSAAAIADRYSINRANRRNFGCCSGEE